MVADKMNELVRRADVQDEIDRWLDSVGTIMVGKGLSSYGELIGCLEDAPAVNAAPVRIEDFPVADAAPTVRHIDADALLRLLDEEEPYNWTDTEAEVQAVTDWEYFRGLVEAVAEEQNKGTG